MRKTTSRVWYILTLISFILISCTQEQKPNPEPEPKPDPTPVTPGQTWSVNGSVQKGPFTQGTSITIQALDESLNPTGKNYTTKTTDDAGAFSIGSQIESRYVEIIATGYYFNEIEGKVSSSTLTLRSLSDLDEKGKTNVNLLTTLESDRMMALVKGGKSVAEARKQAEQEIFRVFNIPNTVGDTGFDKMDITKGTEADAILLAISASLQAGQTVGELSELISKIAGEVASSGTVTSQVVRNKIIECSMKVDADAVRENLTKRYKALGKTDFVIPPFEDYLDVDGNGSIDKKDSWIILGQSEFVVSDKGGTFTLELQHNVDYEVSVGDCSWLSWEVTKAYLEDAKIVFTAQSNPETEARYAVISIKDKASSHVEKATVTQKQKDALTVSASSVELEKEGGSFDLTLNYNADYQIKYDDAPWLSIVQTKAMQTSTVTFEAVANPEVETRVGHIVVTLGELSETVTVYQKGGRSIILSEKNVTVGPGAGSVSVQATANVDYEVIGPAETWLSLQEDSATKAVVTNNYTWRVEENTTGESRQAVITFKDKESDLSESLTITQLQNDVIEGQDCYSIPWEGGTLDVPVQTNTEFTPTIEQEGNWLSIVETKALHASTITLSAQQNPDIMPRTACLVLTSSQDSWRITITQKANAQQVTVNVPTAGTLSQVISTETLHKIINLKIVGKLNEEDLELLKGANSDWCVEELDLSEMTTTTNETGAIFQAMPNLVKVVMPLHIEKVTVNAFRNCPALEVIDFGTDSGILVMGGDVYVGFGGSSYTGEGAFKECLALKSVTLPDHLEEIQAGAFYGCTSLEEIIFPETCNVRKLEPSTGEWSSGLQYIVVYLGHFNGCTSLQTVTLPASLKQIKEGALAGGQFQKIVFPDGLTKVEASSLFEDCTRLEEVALPSLITEYAPYMFAGCKNLKKIETAGAITRFGDHCFDGANSELILLDPAFEYGVGVFANMDGESLTIPDGFSVIPNEMFCGWNNLKHVVLPASIKKVGDLAFTGESLESVEIRSTKVAFGTDTGGGSFDSGKNIHVTIGNTVLSVTGNFNAGEVNEITFEAGSQCEEFGIAGGTAIQSISLPSSVKRLTAKAFSRTKIKSISLPESLKVIGEEAFSYCTELPSFAVPETVDTLGNGVFRGCSKLYEFSIPAQSSLKYIGANILSECPEIEPFVINGSEDLTIHPTAFDAFEEVVIGKNIKRLTAPKRAGYWDANPIDDYNSWWYRTECKTSKFKVEEGSVLEELKGGGLFPRNATVTLPSTLQIIGEQVFSNFSGTLNADFSNVVSIGPSAFADCNKPFSLNFSIIETIGDSAFEGCGVLPETISLPAIKTVGTMAFAGPEIKKITFGPKLEQLSAGIFTNEGVTWIGDGHGNYNSEPMLTEIHFQAMTPVGYGFLVGNELNSSLKIYVPAAAWQSYSAAWEKAPWWDYVVSE